MSNLGQAIHIKKEILVRIIKAFLSDNFEEQARLIPYDMRPKGMEVPYRCCVYKERAIIRSRTLAGLGFSIEEDDETVSLAKYAKKALEREEISEQNLTVLQSACKGCNSNKIYVTDLCQACVARPCVSSCKFGAISVVNGRSVIDDSKCKKCQMCVKACPYNAIVKISVPCEDACPVGAIKKDETGFASIDFEKCISCGKCTSACPFGAVHEKSQIIDILKAIKDGKKVIAMIAPAIVGQFPGNVYQLKTAILKAGFTDVYEVAQGADITANIETKEFIGMAARVMQHHIDHLDGLILSDVGLEIDSDFDSATDEERQEVIDMYLQSLDLSAKEIETELAEDEEAKEFFDNPFLKLLVNERKIKVRYGAIGNCKWYDLIVKNVQENSESKTFIYTAKDQFVNELSKSGFEIVLDAKLENNMGNITTLGNTVLEGSDWKLGNDNSLLRQFKEEPLYEIVLNRDLEVTNILDENDKIVISKGQMVYGFYGIVSNKEEHFQLLYNEDDYKVDDDYVITNSKIWFVQGVTYNENGEPDFASGMGLSKDYRGKRLVRQVKTKYDSTIDKYVQIYENNNVEYYGYTEREYVSPTTVQNFITSPSGFVDYNGWEVGGVSVEEATEYPSLTLQGFPDMRDIPLAEIEQTDYTSFLKYRASNSEQLLYNSGIADFRADINGFVDQEQFVFKIKYATAEENSAGRPASLTYQIALPRVRVGSYELKNGVYSLLDVYFDSEGATVQNVDNYVQTIVKCAKSVPYSEMIKNKLGLFLEFPTNTNYYLEDIQFFRYVTYEKDGQNIMAVPGGELVASVRTKYFYYQPGDYKDISEVVYAYEGYEPWLVVSEKYNEDGFEKIRSITAKESNRFNLIQTLCETFECWPKFEIEHNMATGEILLDENDGYRQKKWVTFHEYVGKDNYAGFRYGINLKSIQRTLDSNGAVSKLIVKDNANQFADNGFCSIARASENPIGENFIYDFSYYIQQGLMTFNEINNDLYLDTSGYLGYYKKLRELNKNRDEWIEEQTGLKMDIVDFQSSYQTYKVSVESAEEELRATELGIEQFAGWTYIQLLEIYNKSKAGQTLTKEEQEAMLLWESDELIKKVNQLTHLKNTILLFLNP